MKDKLYLLWKVVFRMLVGIPILAAVVVAFYALIALVGLITAYPMTALTVVVIVLGLLASYAFGNIAVKKWKKRKAQKRFMKEFYD